MGWDTVPVGQKFLVVNEKGLIETLFSIARTSYRHVGQVLFQRYVWLKHPTRPGHVNRGTQVGGTVGFLRTQGAGRRGGRRDGTGQRRAPIFFPGTSQFGFAHTKDLVGRGVGGEQQYVNESY